MFGCLDVMEKKLSNIHNSKNFVARAFTFHQALSVEAKINKNSLLKNL